MRKRVVIDGTPDEVKVSCPVWRGGKSGDDFKGLPITIGYDFRWLCTELSDSGSVVQGTWRENRHVWFCQQGKGQSQPVHPDDGTAADDTGRTQIYSQRPFRSDEDRYPSHADTPALVP